MREDCEHGFTMIDECAVIDNKIARVTKETWIFFVNVNTYNRTHKSSRKITSRRQDVAFSWPSHRKNFLQNMWSTMDGGNTIRKLGRFLSSNMNTQNALPTAVGVMNRLKYFRSNHNAKHRWTLLGPVNNLDGLSRVYHNNIVLLWSYCRPFAWWQSDRDIIINYLQAIWFSETHNATHCWVQLIWNLEIFTNIQNHEACITQEKKVKI